MIAAGLMAGVVAAVAIVPNILTPSHARQPLGVCERRWLRTIPPLDFDTARLAVPDDARGVRFLPSWGCRDQVPTTCTIVQGGSPHILLIGDSEAATTFGMFVGMARRDHLTLSTYASPGCPWQRNLFFDAPDAFHERWTAQCKAVKRDLYDRVLPALRPDIIVATSLDYLSDRTHLAKLAQRVRSPDRAGRGGARAQFAVTPAGRSSC